MTAILLSKTNESTSTTDINESTSLVDSISIVFPRLVLRDTSTLCKELMRRVCALIGVTYYIGALTKTQNIPTCLLSSLKKFLQIVVPDSLSLICRSYEPQAENFSSEPLSILPVPLAMLGDTILTIFLAQKRSLRDQVNIFKVTYTLHRQHKHLLLF